MIIQEYKMLYEKLISISKSYIDRYGFLRGDEESARNHKLDVKYVFDYRFFALTKSTKSLMAFYELLKQGFYEDAVILSRSIYECYLSNRYFEDQFDINVQNDMLTVPVGLMRGVMVEDSGSVRRRDNDEAIDYRIRNPESFIIGKDKSVFYPLYNYLCTMAHCNYSQVSNYLDDDLHFTVKSEMSAHLAHIIGLYTFSKIFESTVLLEGMPFGDENELKECQELFTELTIFLYIKLDDISKEFIPENMSDDLIKKIFRFMKNSFKEQLGRIEKSFVDQIEKQKKVSERESNLRHILLETEQPSLYFEGQKKRKNSMVYYSELLRLAGIPCDSPFIQSEDLWQHTMTVFDRAAGFRKEISFPYAFMLLALTRDIVKERKPSETEEEGYALVEKFLDRISGNYLAKRYVSKMTVYYRRFAGILSDGADKEKIKEIFAGLTFPADLIYLAIAESMLTEEEAKPLFEFAKDSPAADFRKDNLFFFENYY